MHILEEWVEFDLKMHGFQKVGNKKKENVLCSCREVSWPTLRGVKPIEGKAREDGRYHSCYKVGLNIRIIVGELLAEFIWGHVRIGSDHSLKDCRRG